MSSKRRTTWFIAWLHTHWKSKAIRFSSLLGSGMGIALGIFSLAQWITDNSESKAGAWRLLLLGFDGLSWLILELPVYIIAFLLCRPERTYGCVDGFGMMYALFIGMPLFLVVWIVLSGLLGAVVGGLTGFLFNKFFCRMRR